jgi:hypothetical protein
MPIPDAGIFLLALAEFQLHICYRLDNLDKQYACPDPPFLFCRGES